MRGFIVFMSIFAIFLLVQTGCSGCQEEQVVKPTKKRVAGIKKADNKRTANMKKAKAATKKAAAADPKVERRAVTKEELVEVMPEVVKALKDPTFKKEIQAAAEKKDFRGLLTTVMEHHKTVCEKHGIEFEDFVEAMTKYKDDPEFKEYHDQWKEAVRLSRPLK
jgi:hypothetical protein